MSVETSNPFAIAQEQLDAAAKLLRLRPSVHQALREPMKEFSFVIPARMDDGEVKWFRGYRVQYNSARGPCKGASASTTRRPRTRCAPWRRG